jgi:hypothetical protein
MRLREDKEIFGIAFLDVISCALGAVILMIIMARNGDTEDIVSIDDSSVVREVPLDVALSSKVTQLQSELQKINQRTQSLTVRLADIEAGNKELDRQIDAKTQAAQENPSRNIGTMNSIYTGGIPVGREYIIFIIDTSGSMGANWKRVMSTLTAIMEAHPRVKGLQIISDNGAYLLKGYAKKWIPDNISSRNVAIEKLRNWRTLSNSSPVEGLETALKTYASRSDPISIYVLGDDFTGDSFEAVTNTIDRWNIDKNTGERRAIIHGIGFSWGIGDRYATLMREVASQNGGVFVGLQ